MNRMLKKKLALMMFIATSVEVLIVILIFIKQGGILSKNSWFLTFGSLIVIVGISQIYAISIMPFEYLRSKLLRWAMVMNPGASLIFSGICLASAVNPEIETVCILSGILAVLCFLIGFILFMFHFFVRNNNSEI